MYLIPYSCLSVSDQQELMQDARPEIESGWMADFEVEHSVYILMEDGLYYPVGPEQPQ